jgi:glycosyltransferase involved in cell wall biosynthesis
MAFSHAGTSLDQSHSRKVMRVALIHDWILGLRGGERVLDALCELYPSATLYTLFYRPGTTTAAIDRHRVVTSPLNRLPHSSRIYRYLLPLYPWAVEQFQLQDYDLVVSCSHAVAKGAVPGPRSPHLCYCFTPMRYIWDLFTEYQSSDLTPQSNRFGLRLFRRYLQRWDLRTSTRVSEFAAISSYVAERIRRCYSREARLIYPPTDTDFFTPDPVRGHQGDYFLLVSALVPYKRVEGIVAAFNGNGLPLYITGDGPLAASLGRRARSNVKFLGYVDDQQLRELYRQARALVYMAREEFGLAPVEAMACGTPVIAYGAGGLAETVIDGQTGLLYSHQQAASLAEAVDRFESMRFDRQAIRAQALRFSRRRFLDEFSAFTREACR